MEWTQVDQCFQLALTLTLYCSLHQFVLILKNWADSVRTSEGISGTKEVWGVSTDSKRWSMCLFQILSSETFT